MKNLMLWGCLLVLCCGCYISKDEAAHINEMCVEMPSIVPAVRKLAEDGITTAEYGTIVNMHNAAAAVKGFEDE